MSDASCPTATPTDRPSPAPTVQKGRFYQTRDGRTVGPIVPGLGMMEVSGYQRNYPWIVPTQMGIPAYPVLQSGCRYWDRNDDDDLMLDTVVDAGNAVLARMIVTIREAITEAEVAGNSPVEIAEAMFANDLIVVRPPRPDPAPHAAEASVAAEAAAEAAAPATTERGPATIRDDDMLAVILEEARREAEAMLGRAAPTQIAIARMVGPGYPLGDAVAAIREADQMAFAGARPQAVDLLSEAIVALAVASIVIREGRE